MGTTVEFNISVSGGDTVRAEKACDAAEAKISRIEGSFSIFDDTSFISKINIDGKKSSVQATPEFFRLIEKAKEYYALTGGAFDVTVAPLTELWGFGADGKRGFDEGAVSETLQYVGFDKIELDQPGKILRFKDPRVKIDLGGIAKGYAVDEAVKIFREWNIRKGIVNVGGDLYCLGSNKNNSEWVIGIRDPEARDKVLARLGLRDKAIATSGNYENFHIYQEKRLGHIIDPRSGLPTSNDLSSVTVIADDCTTADALATAIFVLGGGEGIELVEKIKGVECFLIRRQDKGRQVLTSSGMDRYLR